MKQKNNVVNADEYRLAAIEVACLLHFNIYHELSHEELNKAPERVCRGISVMNEIICRSRMSLTEKLLADSQVNREVKAIIINQELSKMRGAEFSDIIADAEALVRDERNQLRLDFLDELEENHEEDEE